MPGFENINSWLYSRERPPVVPMRLNGTRLSGVSYDFKSYTTLDSGEVGQFDVNSPESTAVQHMTNRNALSGLPDSFVPRGRLRRVVPQMTGGSPSRLGRVRQVQIGEVTYSGGTLTVPCRIVDHLLRASGEPSIETQAVGGQTLRLRCQRLDASWNETTTVFSSPNPSDGTTGLVTFTLPNLASVAGLCRLTAWVDAGAGTTAFEPEQDAWATFEYPLQTTANLPVVELTASPDVGDDKNTATAKRATLQVTRSFATNSALTVNLTLPSGLYLKPGTASDLTATYGFSGTADYNITGSSWTCASPYTTATLTIPANQTTATAQVVTRADELTEQNVIVCRLAPATTYTPGASTSVNILIFDGPYWSVQELAGPPGPPLNSSAGIAVNAGVLNTTGTWGTPPQVVGSGTWHNLSGQPETHGALWLPSTTAQSNPTTDFGLTFRPYGISFRASTAPADRAKVVGSLGNSAYQILDNNSGGTTLPHFSGFTGPSLAWAISPDGTRTVGYSTSFGKTRAALWVGTGTPVDISSGLEDPMNERIGEAKAVNNAGVIVGYSSGFPGGYSIQRPFSNDGNSTVISDDDYLTTHSGWPNANGSGVANCVTSGLNSPSHAAGRVFLDSLSPRVATRWHPDGTGTPSTPVTLGTLLRGQIFDVESEALSMSFINSGLMIVGWSGASPTHSGRKAVFFSNGVVKDFNDRHFIHGPGWSLQAAHSVTGTEVIAGVGQLFGLPRGFLLMPRTAGQ